MSNMLKRAKPSQCISPLSSLFLSHGGDTLCYALVLLSLFSLLLHHLSIPVAASAAPHSPPSFEGFNDEIEDPADDPLIHLADLLPSPSPSPPITRSDPLIDKSSDPRSQSGSSEQSLHPPPKSTVSEFEYWDEDEFEGIPAKSASERVEYTANATASDSLSQSLLNPDADYADSPRSLGWRSYSAEFACVSFLVAYLINYFIGMRKNEKIAMTWAAKFAARNSIFEKNFSILGAGQGSAPLVLKEGHNVFKFYAGGRKYFKGLLATIELKSRHDLISRIYDFVSSRMDEITFEVYMNDEAMDQLIFSVVKNKGANGMHKEFPDLQRFATLMPTPSNRKWVSEKLTVITESKEVAVDLITDAVLDQVFGQNSFEKFGKMFVSVHFSDQHPGTQKKKLLFKFALPDVNKTDSMNRLIALVPYYIELVGKYKLSSQARSKTDAARVKAAQQIHKEYQNARQEAIQKKKGERRKIMEEAEAKLSVEAIHRREGKERSRQMKKTVPKVKTSCA